jgi:hypothetical protein
MDTFVLQGKNIFLMEMYESITQFSLKNGFQTPRLERMITQRTKNSMHINRIIPKVLETGEECPKSR